MSRRLTKWITCVVLLATLLGSHGSPLFAKDLSGAAVKEAIDRGRKFLVSQQAAGGFWDAGQDGFRLGVTSMVVMALPTAFSPFKWRGLVETDGFFSVHEMNVLFDFDPEQGLLLRKPQQAEAVQAAKRSPVLTRFLAFAQWPVWRIVPMDEPPGAQRVQVYDLRFSDDGSAFKAVVEVDASGRILSETFRLRP